MRLKLLLVATLVEGVAVFYWLQHDRASDALWWGTVALLVGEMLETGLSGLISGREVARRWPLGSDGSHSRKVRTIMGTASLAEVGIWIAWLMLAHRIGQAWAAVFLVVLMHLKHQAESMALRDLPYANGLFSLRHVSASLIESAAAIAALALITEGEPLLAAAAFGVGLTIEHALLIDLLAREVETRDIRAPRPVYPQRPRSRLLFRLFEYAASSFPLLWRVVHAVRPLHRLLNRLAINALVLQVPVRPEPLSTLSDYTSWRSLTDRTWSGRHLPPVPAGAQMPVTTDEGPPSVSTVSKLFERSGPMTACPKSTMLFACFAQWFTDGFLRTTRGAKSGRRDTSRNESTHQIDLAQLYGLDYDATHQLRSLQHGRLKSQWINGEEYPMYLYLGGLRRPQFDKLPKPLAFGPMSSAQRERLFAMGTDTRNLGFMAFNVLFLREHNRIAGVLRAHEPGWDDDRLFETARNVLIVVLLKIVIEEYINHINPSRFRFILDPAGSSNARWQRPNWMAVEFNLLYRWHSLVAGTLDLNGRQLNIEDTLSNAEALTSCGLARFMEAASSQPAGRIGLFNTDQFLVTIAEIPSIQQGRQARLRSYNDYRRLCRMQPVRRFSELSDDPKVQKRLEEIYGHVENIEFYVGLFAEEAGPNAVIAPLMTAMVTFDAFSQALTNPLAAPRVSRPETFSQAGWKIIQETTSISDLVHRNQPDPSGDYFISLTRRDYERV